MSAIGIIMKIMSPRSYGTNNETVSVVAAIVWPSFGIPMVSVIDIVVEFSAGRQRKDQTLSYPSIQGWYGIFHTIRAFHNIVIFNFSP